MDGDVMEYFHDEKNIQEYIGMAEGFDGRELIEILKGHLEPGSTVLELGMGPGKDLEILGERYSVTGSDYSRPFIDRYRRIDPDADLLLLDACTLETDRTFDCIYSNKVLMHLQRDEMKASIERQADLLNDGGLLFHSFWKGDSEETKRGVHFVYYESQHLFEMIEDLYDVIEIETYTEFEEDDSIYLIARKR